MTDQGRSPGSRPSLAETPSPTKPVHPLYKQASRVSRTSSRRGTATLRSQLSQTKSSRPPDSNWGRVRNAVRRGTLVAVGLKQTGADKLHWNAIQRNVQATATPTTSSTSSPHIQPTPRLTRLRSRLSYHDVPAAHIAYPFSRQASSVSTATRRGLSITGETGRSRSSSGVMQPDGGQSAAIPLAYGTGRVQAVRSELKPDLWKIAYKGVRRLVSQSEQPKPSTESLSGTLTRRGDVSFVGGPAPPPPLPPRSFLDLGDSDDEEGVEEFEGVDGGMFETDVGSMGPPSGGFMGTIVEHDEDFFGTEGAREEVDAPLARVSLRDFVPETMEPIPKPKPAPRRRGRIGLPHVIRDPLFGGYDRGYGGLGLPSFLLRFKYRYVSPDVQRRLDNHLLHKRPYFTYWLMMVHFIIMVTAVSVYGIAPYGWDQKAERGTVQGSNLALDTEEKIIIPSVWVGPPQRALVLLGALYGPCMRRDRQLFEAVEEDRNMERNQSGCCVRLDGSGCVQEPNEEECGSSNLIEFVYSYEDEGVEIRGVCGTSPRTCIDPRPGLDSSSWVPDNILTWPICLESINVSSNESRGKEEPHLTCEITGRPCCVGIQALCIITTRDHCDFLEGRFHQDAFLCSQVDCLNTTCGLLPFRVFNEPDQVYRLWIALFMHAGLVHLFLSLLFSFFVLRHVEKRMGWVRTSILYIVSGVGGNLVSAFFVPYNPQVGPAGSIVGVVAYMFVFLIFESRLLIHPSIEFLKLGIIVLFLFVLGLFPFIDNFAHIGGFIFGFLLSGILVPYHSLENLGIPQPRMRGRREKLGQKRDVFRIVKWAMVIVGIPAVIILFVIFFILFYVVQDTWDGFRYFNCIPFTNTICQDLGGNIRTRDDHII